MSSNKHHGVQRSGKFNQYSESQDADSFFTPILKARQKQSKTIVFDESWSPKERKEKQLPQLNYSPIQSIQGSPQFRESIITQTDNEKIQQSSSIIPTFYGNMQRPRIKLQQGDIKRTQKLQNKMHFQTFEETNCTPSNLLISTKYAFSPQFEGGMFSSHATSTKSIKYDKENGEENKEELDVYQRQIDEIRKRVQAKLREQHNRNSFYIGPQSGLTPSNQKKKYSMQFQHKQQNPQPVIVVIEQNNSNHKQIPPRPPQRPQQITRNGAAYMGQTQNFSRFTDPSKRSASFHENEVIPQRVRHLLSRMQHQFKSFHIEEHASVIERVFQAKVLEEGAFPSIKRHNEATKK